ncbi:MAG: Coenzyme F420 hydrogenase/dehydrogenase, beta subunit C-terminal domain [archaeon]|nr:Coenzyme F420 hydrogenase/dehydrogenase, beta subunit C-terminal domain [archaeon]
MQMVYSLSAKSKRILKNSSSGGAFYLVAKYYIKILSGVVYGATCEGVDVYHKRIDSLRQIKELQKSKYVKSELRNVFFEVKSDLENDKYVLFVGLPCQVFSLSKYLEIQNISNEKLFCIDLICHGVPNKKTFNEYIEKKFPNEIIKKIDFRYKNPFWQEYSIYIKTNKRNYINYKFNDEYLASFLKGYNLDDVCYNCKFKGDNRKSTITIGDFWRVKSLYPKFYNNRGTSLIVVHDEEKFRKVLDYFCRHAEIHAVDFEKALKPNPSYFYANKKPTDNFDIVLKDRNTNFKQKIKSIIKFIFKRL